jgi:hypothetical protein
MTTMDPDNLLKLKRIEQVLRCDPAPMAFYLADTIADVIQGRPEPLLKLRRIERTLRSTGKPAAVHLADDLLDVITVSTGLSGLNIEELECLKAGNFINAIKLVRIRKSASDMSFGLKEAKDFVEAAAEALGYFRRDGHRWTKTPFKWE